MKKILYIGNKLASKGATVTSIETLGSFLAAEGFQVATSSAKKNQALRLADMLWAVHKHAKNLDYVLIDTYSTKNFWYAYAVAKLCKIYSLKYIPILRGGKLPQRIKTSAVASGFLFKNASTNVAPSAYLLNEFKEAGFSKLKFIPNTIQIKNYPFLERKQLRPKLLWVRSFARLYNPLLALKILEKLVKIFPEAELCMVGPEKDDSFLECKDYAERNNLHVKFTGKLEKEDWINLSKDYDIFLNTTNFDNTPVSVMEAMALGLTVLSTNVGGIPFLLKNQKEGILLEPNNAHLFVTEIKQLIENPEQALKMQREARTKAELFDWEVVKQDWIKILA